MSTILLVEDEPLIALLVGEELRDAGHGVVWASSPFDARSIIESKVGELTALVTDIDLGSGPCGFELAAKARALRSDLPVVYVTGRPSAQVLRLGVPGSALIPKPFQPSEIANALARVTALQDARAA